VIAAPALVIAAPGPVSAVTAPSIARSLSLPTTADSR